MLLRDEDGTVQECDMLVEENDEAEGVYADSEEVIESEEHVYYTGAGYYEEECPQDDEEQEEQVHNIVEKPPLPQYFRAQGKPVQSIRSLISAANLKNPTDCIKCALAGHQFSNKLECPYANIPLTDKPCFRCTRGLHPPWTCSKGALSSATHPADARAKQTKN